MIRHIFETSSSNRAKVPLLCNDSGALNADISVIPIDSSDFQLIGLPEAIGYMYVTEGSTLGGQILAKELRKKFGDEVPCAFFSGYARRTGEMWKEFSNVVNSLKFDEDVQARAIESAKSTFRSMRRWLVE